ncbi:hypothetical protein QQP08_025645 [Theobroma cacao]|nr:hypothetical protein QQP08_025645 [Theobroma cacao]
MGCCSSSAMTNEAVEEVKSFLGVGLTAPAGRNERERRLPKKAEGLKKAKFCGTITICTILVVGAKRERKWAEEFRAAGNASQGRTTDHKHIAIWHLLLFIYIALVLMFPSELIRKVYVDEMAAPAMNDEAAEGCGRKS